VGRITGSIGGTNRDTAVGAMVEGGGAGAAAANQAKRKVASHHQERNAGIQEEKEGHEEGDRVEEKVDSALSSLQIIVFCNARE